GRGAGSNRAVAGIGERDDGREGGRPRSVPSVLRPGRVMQDALEKFPTAAALCGASDMKLYNTQSAALEPFRASSGSASLYVCGITPYHTTHLGHALPHPAPAVPLPCPASHS